jgi:hypothetical protein
MEEQRIHRVPATTGLFFCREGHDTPGVVVQLMARLRSLPSRTVFVSNCGCSILSTITRSINTL